MQVQSVYFLHGMLGVVVSMVDTVRTANGINMFVSGCIFAIVLVCNKYVCRKCHVPIDRLTLQYEGMT